MTEPLSDFHEIWWKCSLQNILEQARLSVKTGTASGTSLTGARNFCVSERKRATFHAADLHLMPLGSGEFCENRCSMEGRTVPTPVNKINFVFRTLHDASSYQSRTS